MFLNKILAIWKCDPVQVQWPFSIFFLIQRPSRKALCKQTFCCYCYLSHCFDFCTIIYQFLTKQNEMGPLKTQNPVGFSRFWSTKDLRFSKKMVNVIPNLHDVIRSSQTSLSGLISHTKNFFLLRTLQLLISLEVNVNCNVFLT